MGSTKRNETVAGGRVPAPCKYVILPMNQPIEYVGFYAKLDAVPKNSPILKADSHASVSMHYVAFLRTFGRLLILLEGADYPLLRFTPVAF